MGTATCTTYKIKKQEFLHQEKLKRVDLTLVSWQLAELIWGDVLSSSVVWTLLTLGCCTKTKCKQQQSLSQKESLWQSAQCQQQQILVKLIQPFFCCLHLTLVTAAVPWLAFLPWSSTPCSHCSCHLLPPHPLLPPPLCPLPPPPPLPLVEELPSFVPFFP